MNNYYIKNDLIDYADMNGFHNYTGHKRDDAIRHVLPDSATLFSEYRGSYQGELVLLIECDGYVWLHFDYFGSCSHCDPFLDNEKSWTEKMLREAYCFENSDDLRTYLDESDDIRWSFEALKDDIREMLDENFE